MNVSKIHVNWYQNNHRELPWKQTRDPYIIWLSEIILQQTRVNQGLPYFQRFAERYPFVQDLAKAPENEVLKLWQGLGYYSRARNLHATAKIVNDSHKGIFPVDFQALKKLPGIGDYTAAAIASFAGDRPHAVVDGNVYRVLSRLFGVTLPIDTTPGKKFFNELANNLLDKKRPGIHNQAIMEFGAMLCKPQTPSCNECPLIKMCVAYDSDAIERLPVKLKSVKIKERYFNYLLVRYENRIYLNQRLHVDIWKTCMIYL